MVDRGMCGNCGAYESLHRAVPGINICGNYRPITDISDLPMLASDILTAQDVFMLRTKAALLESDGQPVDDMRSLAERIETLRSFKPQP